MTNTDSFLPTWLDSLVEGYTLTAEDLPRLARAAQAIRNGAKHHEQARAITAADHIAALVAMGWTEYASEFGSYHSVIAPEKRDER